MQLLQRTPPRSIEIESCEIRTSVSVYDPIYIDHGIDAKLEIVKEPSYFIVTFLCKRI